MGQPQSGHSNWTRGGWVFAWTWKRSWEVAQTGQGARDWTASPLARMAGEGDFEKGWNKLSRGLSFLGSLLRKN